MESASAAVLASGISLVDPLLLGAFSFEWLLYTTAARVGLRAECPHFDSYSVHLVLIQALFVLLQTVTPNHLNPGFTRSPIM